MPYFSCWKFELTISYGSLTIVQEQSDDLGEVDLFEAPRAIPCRIQQAYPERAHEIMADQSFAEKDKGVFTLSEHGQDHLLHLRSLYKQLSAWEHSLYNETMA